MWPSRRSPPASLLPVQLRYRPRHSRVTRSGNSGRPKLLRPPPSRFGIRSDLRHSRAASRPGRLEQFLRQQRHELERNRLQGQKRRATNLTAAIRTGEMASDMRDAMRGAGVGSTAAGDASSRAVERGSRLVVAPPAVAAAGGGGEEEGEEGGGRGGKKGRGRWWFVGVL